MRALLLLTGFLLLGACSLPGLQELQDEYRKRLSDLDLRSASLERDLRAGKLTEENFHAFRRAYEEERAALEREVAAAKRAAAEAATTRVVTAVSQGVRVAEGVVSSVTPFAGAIPWAAPVLGVLGVVLGGLKKFLPNSRQP